MYKPTLERLPVTVELGLKAFVLSLLIGLPLGLIAGYYSNKKINHVIINGSIFAYSIPNFWQGLLFILFFAVSLQWFPAGDRGETVDIFGYSTGLLTGSGWQHLFLPSLNLALFNSAMVIRLTCASIQEVMSSEYIRYVRAKGISEKESCDGMLILGYPTCRGHTASER